MNKFVRISTSLLLSLFILVSGSGLIIGKMVCLKSGYVQISAKEAKECCDDQPANFSYNDNCCAINNLTFEQQHFVGQGQQLIKTFPATAFVALPHFAAVALTDHYITCFNFPADPPDLLSGSDALPLLGVFRV